MADQSVRDDVERLAAMPRESASEGEAAAAQALAEMLRERGLEPMLEREASVGGYWQSTGALAGAGAVAGMLAGRARVPAVLAGLVAALLMADDVEGRAHLARRLLPKRQTTNVLAWAGDLGAARTLVLVAHHDAAHSGLMFHPRVVPAIARALPGLYARQRTSTQTGRLLVAGPALSALGAALASRRVRRAGVIWSVATAALLADVARSPVVAGANDNLSAVGALLAVAQELSERPVSGLRVLLLSTGSEESFMEGMRGFITRHRAELDPAETSVLALECLGSPRLAILEGEGMLRMTDYDVALREQLQGAADEAQVEVWRGLRLGAGATDALPAMRAGYRAACLAACTELKVPANYHWPSDVAANLDWDTIDGACRVLAALIRRAGSRESALSA